jgi:sulfur-oxidizing protein SoxY
MHTNVRHPVVRGAYLALLACLLLPAVLPAARAAGPDGADSEIWRKVRASLFESRPIEVGEPAFVTLEAPVRAEDAATVPVAIRTGIPTGGGRQVRRLWLVIDRNPSPIAAIFTFTADSGRADVETRVRIDEYTWVRAIAETSDGKLYMTSRYVKASGGCSAPAGKDQAAALTNLGRMKLRLDDEPRLNRPNLVQLMISHPNNSGFAMDQVTHLYVPAFYVRQIRVAYAGKTVMEADVDFSISENPNFRFYFVPREPGELTAEVVDSSDRKFHGSIPVKPMPDRS